MIKKLQISRRLLLYLSFLGIPSLLTILLVSEEKKPVVLPMLALVNITVYFIAKLSQKDKNFPFFDIGFFFVTITFIYSFYPLFVFLINNLEWTVFNDGRLRTYNPSAEKYGGFMWRHVVYLFSFIIIYLTFRCKDNQNEIKVVKQNSSILLSCLILFICMDAFLRTCSLIFGEGSYPYVYLQFAHNISDVMLFLKLFLMVFLFQNWNVKKWKWILVSWILYDLAFMVYNGSGRTYFVLSFLSCLLLYHRLVKPLSFSKAILTGFLLILGALFYGVVRHQGIDQAMAGMTFLISTNEFEAMVGTAYDIYIRKNELQTLPAIPFQLYFSDLLMLIPSQLLPFYKWDPSQWYLEVLGLRGTGVGFMFGVISQAVIGLDWIELIIRGSLLGYLGAIMHKWYVKNTHGNWATVFYVFMCIKVYYTYRASSFYMLYTVIYDFFGAIALVILFKYILTSVNKSKLATV